MNEELRQHLKIKQFFYGAIHITFVSSILYAFYHFVRTPRIFIVTRRMWAYEFWIIISFYALFIYLILTDREGRLKRREVLEKFQRILRVNLLLLLFPWGLFLILVPKELLLLVGLGAFYWRVLGLFSLFGFLLYLFPYKFHRHKVSYYILFFGIIDNFLAATIVLILFLERQVPLAALSAVPLLYYFSFFFYEQVRRFKEIASRRAP